MVALKLAVTGADTCPGGEEYARIIRHLLEIPKVIPIIWASTGHITINVSVPSTLTGIRSHAGLESAAGGTPWPVIDSTSRTLCASLHDARCWALS